jgi:hypothetical protein
MVTDSSDLTGSDWKIESPLTIYAVKTSRKPETKTLREYIPLMNIKSVVDKSDKLMSLQLTDN